MIKITYRTSVIFLEMVYLITFCAAYLSSIFLNKYGLISKDAFYLGFLIALIGMFLTVRFPLPEDNQSKGGTP